MRITKADVHPEGYLTVKAENGDTVVIGYDGVYWSVSDEERLRVLLVARGDDD